MDIESQRFDSEEPVEPVLRFQTDLEFIQSLTNPHYIECFFFTGNLNLKS